MWIGECVNDYGLTDRLLPDVSTMIDLNSPEVCMSYCSDLGFFLSGVQYGKECFCGGSPVSREVIRPDEECNMPCPGNNSVACGGPWRMNVWTPKGPSVKRPIDIPYMISFFQCTPQAEVLS